MELFDKKYMYLEWDDVLEGTEVFVADTLPELRSRVERGSSDFLCTVKKNDGDYPFIVNEAVCYAFVYYDPNYECKRAYAQGKMIQTRNSNAHWDWADCQSEPQWKDGFEYRVKPEEPEQAMNRVWFNKKTKCMVYGPVDEERDTGSYQELFTGTADKCCQYILDRAHINTIMAAYYCDNKQVQFRNLVSPSGCTDWTTCTPTWLLNCEYRVKPEEDKCNTCSYQCEPDMPCNTCRDGSNYKPRIVVKPKHKRRMTNRELARWLAEDNGQLALGGTAYTDFAYSIDEDSKPVSNSYKIRGWDETEWRKPFVEE